MTGRSINLPRGRETLADRGLALRLAINWEIATYAGIFVAAFALRFWDLGARALHHDESIHAQWSWDLLRGNYHHSPIFHGPFYYHAEALVMLLFGASDYTARVSAAIFGAALVAMPLLLRKRLGTAGTIAAMGMIAFSPTLVYYSRFFREDIYLAFFTLLMVVGIWRYIDDGRTRWLVVTAAGFAGGVLTKEGAFISTAVMLVYLDLYLAAELATATLAGRDRQVRAEWEAAQAGDAALAGEQPGPVFNTAIRRTVLTLALAPWAWMIAALWPFMGGLRDRMDWPAHLPRPGDLLVLIGTLTLPLLTPVSRHYVLEPLGLIEKDRLSWEKSLATHVSASNALALLGLFSVTTSLAAFAGLQWRPKVWIVIFAICAAVYLTLMTSFWTNKMGLVSGPWGSLDYWITQQKVARGDQPWFYYYMLMPAYEFLPLVLVIGGFWWATIRGNAFSRFLAFWMVGMWLALSYASEKMPWNNVHIALPAVLLAAWVVHRAWDSWQVRPPLSRTAFSLISIAAIAAGGLALVAFLPVESVYNVIRAVVVLAVAASIAYTARPWGRRAVPAVLVVSAVGALAFFSVRTMELAVFERGDVPKDLLIYTQSSPDIPRIATEIDQLAQATGQGFNLPIAVDSADSFSWPWAWYLRDYKNVAYVDMTNGLPAGDYAVLLVDNTNAGHVNDQLVSTGDTRYAAPKRYPHRWWFDEGYKFAMSTGHGACSGLSGDCGPLKLETWKTVAKGVFDKGWLGTWLEFWRDHDPDEILHATGDRACNSCGSVDAWAYFPSNYDPKTGTLSAKPLEPPKPTQDKDGRPMFGGIGPLPGQFFAPVDVESDAQGNLYVIDSSTKRLQKFDKNGNYLAGVDIRLTPGSTQEQSQPWGLAVSPDGTVVVADTFGWRIRVFDSNLQPTGVTFGQPPNTNAATPGPYDLFGPRDAIIDAHGDIWVTDTGDDRIVIYDAQGKFIRQVGGVKDGTGPGEFNEPVGIALAPDGSVYVADMYNSRVEILDKDGNYLSEFHVDGWGGQGVTDKPYLRVLHDGRVAVSLPSLNQVRIYDRSGKLLGTINPADEPLSRPYGLVETADGKLWVSEGGNGRLRLFDIPK